MKQEPCTAINPIGTLYTEVTSEGAGEVGGFAEGPIPGTVDDFLTILSPPILLVPNDLTINHTPPLRKSGVYRATMGGVLSKDGDFNYMTGVISRGPWAVWSDTIRIGYMENPPHGPVYNYVYAKDIGPVHFWYGELNPDDTLKWGIEYYATAWGGQ